MVQFIQYGYLSYDVAVKLIHTLISNQIDPRLGILYNTQKRFAELVCHFYLIQRCYLDMNAVGLVGLIGMQQLMVGYTRGLE